jgi:hypothetical protein
MSRRSWDPQQRPACAGKEKGSIMRRTFSVLATAAMVGTLALVVTAPAANASVTEPSNNATLRGNATLQAKPGGQFDAHFYCSHKESTTLYLRRGGHGGSAVYSASNGGGTLTRTITTESYPNGTYTVQAHRVDRVNGGFLGLGCGTKTYNYYRTVHIDNRVSISYTGAKRAPANTSATVTAYVKDPHLNSKAVSGITATFHLSGGASVSGKTGANGGVSRSLAINGPPRSTTLHISTNKTAYYDANSVNVGFTVTKDGSRTTLSSSANPSVHGQPVHFTAHVARTEGTGTPTGSVQFTVDGHNFGAAVGLSGGTARSPSTSSLSTGGHSIGARYSGSSYFSPSSGSLTQTVNKAQTTTTLDSSVNPSVHGQPVTFTAHVAVQSPGAGTPTGSVQFSIDGNPYGTAQELTGDHASVTVSNLSGGNHPVQATYNGNTNFAASTSATLSQGIDKAATATALQLDPNPVTYGAPVQLSATVTATPPGAGTPTGAVQFSIDGQPVGDPVSLAGGTATTTTNANLTPGAHDVTADYVGDDNFSGSMDTKTLNVEQAATTTTVTSSANPSVFGQPVTFTANVAPVAPSTSSSAP